MYLSSAAKKIVSASFTKSFTRSAFKWARLFVIFSIYDIESIVRGLSSSGVILPCIKAGICSDKTFKHFSMSAAARPFVNNDIITLSVVVPYVGNDLPDPFNLVG